MNQTCEQIGRAVTIALSFLLLATALAAPLASARAEDSDVVVIEDITSWHHPVKKVFAKYAIKIYKVQLFGPKTYPVFHVEFPFEPTEGHGPDPGMPAGIGERLDGRAQHEPLRPHGRRNHARRESSGSGFSAGSSLA